MVILSFLISSAMAFAIGSVPNHEVEYREYDSNGVDRITISNSSGRIALAPMPLRKVEITVNKRKFGDRCSLTVKREMFHEVIIKVEKPLGEVCEVDMDVRVPREILADITSGSGNVTVEGLQNELRFDLGTGNLKASGLWKKITGKTGSGDVDIKGIRGPIALKVGSGQVKLGFTEDAKGDVDVSSGNGDALLLFPKGTKLKTALSTGSGSIFNDTSDVLRPELNVSVKTGSGDLSVKTF